MPLAGAVTTAGRVLEVSGQGEELLFMLFPHLRGLRIGQVEDTGDTVVIRASCRAAQARCPLCGAVSSRGFMAGTRGWWPMARPAAGRC